MIIYPAIDLYKNKVVRLRQGDFSQPVYYPLSPLTAAKSFVEAGASWVHIIDLEGAQEGHPAHLHIIKPMRELGLSVQYGGGLRTIKDVKEAFQAGASRLYVGSLICQYKDIAEQLYKSWGDLIIPAIDIKRGKVTVKGWTTTLQHSPAHLLDYMYYIGYTTMLVTAVQKDGTAEGPDKNLYIKLKQIFPGLSFIAAGGIASLVDIAELKAMGLEGAVVGRALYDGIIHLKDILNEVALCQ